MSAPEVVATIEELEKKYKVDLAAIVIRIMIKDLMVNGAAEYFTSELKIEDVKADQLAAELKEKVFAGVTDYLGIKNAHGNVSAAPHASKTSYTTIGSPLEKRANFFFSPEDEQEIRALSKKINNYAEQGSFGNHAGEKLDKIIKQTQVNFGSAQLSDRFKQILQTYFRGIRDRIEAKQTLIKPFEAGGLNFDQESAEKILLIADGNFKDLGEANEIKFSAPGVSGIKITESDKRKLGDLEDNGLISPSASDQRVLTRPSKQIGLAQVAEKKEQSKPDQDRSLGGIRDIDYDLATELKKKKDGEKSNELDIKYKLAPPPPRLRRTGPLSSYSQSHKAPAVKSLQERHSPSIKKDVEIKTVQSINPIKKMPPALDKVHARGQKDFSNRVNHDYGLASQPGQARQDSPAIRPALPPPFAKSGVREVRCGERRGKIGDKVKMEDVKYVPKIVSPIDELKYMSLVNFRRLEQDLNKIIIKIKQKIDLLEEEDYTQRLAGIKAWRVSPVNRLYLEMGQASINSNKPIDVVIKERKAKGQEYLNSYEFKAVMDLNKDLRF